MRLRVLALIHADTSRACTTFTWQGGLLDAGLQLRVQSRSAGQADGIELLHLGC